MKFRLTTFAVVFVALFAQFGLVQDAEAGRKGKQNLVETLVDDGRFGTLVQGVSDLGLAETVASERLTIFAPTDEAFDNLFAALAEAGIEPTVDDLRNIVLYHVLPGNQRAGRLLFRTTAQTLQGSDVVVSYEGRHAFVNRSKIIDTNIRASNGTIHAIDAVLPTPGFPNEPTDTVVKGNTIAGLLTIDGRFNILLAAVGAANLADALSQGDALTVFAPTDEAFLNTFSEDDLTFLTTTEEGKAALTNVLLYHVAEGRKGAFRLLFKRKSSTLLGSPVYVQLIHRTLFINDAAVQVANLRAGRGFVHVIDGVLMPPGM